MEATTTTTHFSDNFWESLDKNGITILIERMRGAKQTCEKFKHAYESRALLEEEYGKTLLQIAQKQKISTVENGSSQNAMDTMQQQFQVAAESHLQLASLLRNNVVVPVTNLINKQKTLRKELQTSIQKLYNNRQVQAHFVRRAHKRHNLEIEKANLLVQQQESEKDKIATFKSASITIDKLKKVYDDALQDLSSMVEDWNTEWVNTCQAFEKLEQERLTFFKSNLSDCANLMIGCHEAEIQACEKINVEANKIDVVQDLVEFVQTNKSTHVIPTAKDYLKLHAYHEANQGTKFSNNDIDQEDQSESEDRPSIRPRRSESSQISKSKSVKQRNNHVESEPVVKSEPAPKTEPAVKTEPVKTEPVKSEPVKPEPVKSEPVLMVGVMEVYPSDDDEEDYEYVTDSESEPESEVETIAEPMMTTEKQKQKVVVEEEEKENKDPKVDRFMSTYQEMNPKEPPSLLASKTNSFNTNRRVSFIDTTTTTTTTTDSQDIPTEPSHTLERFNSFGMNYHTKEPEEYTNSAEEAAFELDDMLRELDSKRIIRDGTDESVRFRVKPTASISSPSLLQKQQQRRSNIPSSQYFPNPQSRRLSNSFSPGSMDVYDPFNSLSSKETMSTLGSNSSRRSSINPGSSIISTNSTTTTTTTPSAQSIHDRMLNNQPVESQSSVGSNSRFLQEYNTRNQVPKTTEDAVLPDRVAGFIDFAYALYDYEEQDEGEISFKEGDLLGVISKSDEDDEQGWWEASLLNPRNRRPIKTGLVPSNFLEAVSK